MSVATAPTGRDAQLLNRPVGCRFQHDRRKTRFHAGPASHADARSGDRKPPVLSGSTLPDVAADDDPECIAPLFRRGRHGPLRNKSCSR